MNIGKITIKNFKNYMDDVTFDLSKKIIILHGANGFGKSTFFDAIEWCLTGKINRFDGTEIELKYDIANKRILDQNFEVSVSLMFGGDILTRYFNVVNGIPGNLQVKILCGNGEIYNGQEQIESYLKIHTLKDAAYERGKFNQLLKQAYLLSQEQVTDFIASEDAKERYKALANILGLKSVLTEFDNFKKILAGFKNKRKSIYQDFDLLKNAIKNKLETMHVVDEEKLNNLLNTYSIQMSQNKVTEVIESKIVELLGRKSSLENYIEFYNSIDKELQTKSLADLINLTKVMKSEKNLLIDDKEKAEGIIQRLDNKFTQLSNIIDNLEVINSLKENLNDLQSKWNKLGINENSNEQLNIKLAELRNEKLKIEFNLNAKQFENDNGLRIEGFNKQNSDIITKVNRLNRYLEKNNRLLGRISEIIQQNKDQVLARLISGIKDIQLYTDKYNLDYCPICSSKKSNLSSEIITNLNYYVSQLNEETKYYEKVIKLHKSLEKREGKLNSEVRLLQNKLEKNNLIIKDFIDEIANYKNSALFNDDLFSLEQEDLTEKLKNKNKEIKIRKDAIDLLLEINKLKGIISDNEKSTQVSMKVKSLEKLISSLEKNKDRKNLVNKKYIELKTSINEVTNSIERLESVTFNLKNIMEEKQFDQELININKNAVLNVQKMTNQVKELNYIKEICLKVQTNELISSQIKEIQKKENDLSIKIGKLDNYINILEKYRDDKQSYLGSGIADFLNRNNSTVQRYFRYLNPIPNNSQVIFEGDENQLNIKVAFDKALIDKPGGRSNAKNILSSGQLNVLAISIFLAINNEQKIHSLDFVGIDDPIQNMDDINQYSMCDVLNSISKQLIISTHDMNFLKLFIKKNEHRKEQIIVYNFNSPYINSKKIDKIEFQLKQVRYHISLNDMGLAVKLVNVKRIFFLKYV